MNTNYNQLIEQLFTSKFCDLIEELLLDKYIPYLSSDEIEWLRTTSLYIEEYTFREYLSENEAREMFYHTQEWTAEDLEEWKEELDWQIEQDIAENKAEKKALESEYYDLIKL